ncbi:MAG: nucleotidyl transferase AbiEii/AbiGii toxin family protein [bacterium]
MSEKYYINDLYPLQDEVLDLISRLNTDFYLSGGTALSRVYLKHRYSDDLDFFQNDSGTFRKDAESIIKEIKKKKFWKLETALTDESFVRLFLNRNDIVLKIEMINDVSFHEDGFIADKIFDRVDSWENILSNKISALSRNEPKDMADILFLCKEFKFNWMKVIESAKKKDMWVNEIEISRIFNNYSAESMKDLKWIDSPDYEKLSEKMKKIARSILFAEDNK